MKYKKRPVVVDAVQWFKDGDHPAVKPYYDRPALNTRDGSMWIAPGDWIITDTNGEHDTCSQDIFELTYEVVDET